MDMTEKVFELLGRKEFENSLLKEQIAGLFKRNQELQKIVDTQSIELSKPPSKKK